MLALSGAALSWRRVRGRAALLLAGAGGALAIAMGPHGPLYPVLVALVPPLRMFRYPSKALFVVALLLALAAGLGIAAIRRGRTAGLPVLAGFLLAGGLAAAFVGPRYGAVDTPVLAVTLAAAAAAVAVLAAREGLAPGLAALALAALAAADLLAAHVGLNPTALPSLLVDPPPLVAHVDRSEGRRLYVYDYHSLPGTSEKRLGRPHPYAYLTPPPGWDSALSSWWRCASISCRPRPASTPSRAATTSTSAASTRARSTTSSTSCARSRDGRPTRSCCARGPWARSRLSTTAPSATPSRPSRACSPSRSGCGACRVRCLARGWWDARGTPIARPPSRRSWTPPSIPPARSSCPGRSRAAPGAAPRVRPASSGGGPIACGWRSWRTERATSSWPTPTIPAGARRSTGGPRPCCGPTSASARFPFPRAGTSSRWSTVPGR